MNNESIQFQLKVLHDEIKSLKGELDITQLRLRGEQQTRRKQEALFEETCNIILGLMEELTEKRVNVKILPSEVTVKVDNAQVEGVAASITQVKEEIQKQKDFTDTLAQMIATDYNEKAAEMMKAIKNKRDIGGIDL